MDSLAEIDEIHEEVDILLNEARKIKGNASTHKKRLKDLAKNRDFS